MNTTLRNVALNIGWLRADAYIGGALHLQRLIAGALCVRMFHANEPRFIPATRTAIRMITTPTTKGNSLA